MNVERDDDRIREPVIGDDNKLTLRILPAYFSTMNKEYRSKVAFTQDGEVWFNLRELAHWWYERHHGRINTRLETEDALATQLKALFRAFPDQCRSERARVRAGDQDGTVRRFKVLSGDLAKLVLLRAEG